MAFFWFPVWSSHTTIDIETIVSDRIARVVNRSGATRAITLVISVGFDGVLHAELLQKLKSYGVLVRFLVWFYLLSIRHLWLVRYGNPLREYPINAGVLQGCATYFLLYTSMISWWFSVLHTSVIFMMMLSAVLLCTTLYPKSNWASDLWQ